MPGKWLNLFLRFSGYIFSLKQKIVGAKSWVLALPYVFLLLLTELLFLFISLPLYLIVSPKKLQERGFVFPAKEKELTHFHVYVVRRKISLATVFGTGGIFLLKFVFIGLISTYLLGAQALLAATQSWPFDTAGNYTYDSAKIEVTGGVAQLKGTGSCSGTATACDTYGTQSPCDAQDGCSWSAGSCNNNGVCGNISAKAACNACNGCTYNNPGKVCQGALNCSGQGVCGDCSICTSVAANCSGTAAACDTYGTQSLCDAQDGCSWSEAYATDKPTINPTASLNPANVTTWDSFTETATKNGGEIYYQLSDDDGATWQYWNGSAWAAASASNYNTASVVNTNISSFSTSNNKIMWKAFLESNGSQQVIIDQIDIGYTENDLPDILNLSPSQNADNGTVYVNYDLQDAESDPSNLVTYEYSLTGAFSGEEEIMTASSTEPSHDGISALESSPGGTNHDFVWDAITDLGNIYDDTVYVRLRANDGVGNGGYATSSAFAVDFVAPIVSNVSAAQTAGTTNVAITYDLADDTGTDLLVEIDISEDSGGTWAVTDTSLTGDVGASVSTGAGKSITWDAGTDFDEQAQADLRVRVRAKDKYQNQGANVESIDFILDTVNPATNATSNLQAQPNAGDTMVLIGGSFTETNPNTNDFYVEINSGSYSDATAGDTNTASPSNQAAAVGATLDGNDYISKVKITHTDDYGQTGDNENTSPAVSYKYVKPYTPQAPTLSSPITTQLDLTINKHASETSGLEYTIQETTSGNYVQADGTLGVSEVWQTDSVWGTKTITGLSSPVSQYIFKVKSRNTSDAAHAASSESAYSATAQITNTAPSIALDSYSQTTDGTQYVTIDYTGADGQGDLNDITVYEYSQNNSTWYTMTEKTGVDSDGISDLVFLSGGSAHDFMWDSGADLSGIEDSTVYVRLRSNDATVNSNLAASSAFEIDNILPVVSGVSASQTGGSTNVSITYTLTDANNSTVEIDISDDSGFSWTVTDTSVSGNVGSGVTPGSKTITWNAGTDFNNQYQTDLRVRVRAQDTFGNQGSYSESADFTLDTKDPVVSNVSALQDSGLKTSTFNYTVSEDIGNVTIGLEISSNGGSTWTVPITSAAGDIGAGITPGSRTITWDAGTDYNGYEEQDMQIRITATDQFTNSGNNTSANFTSDALAPRITNVSATQSGSVAITYDLADINWSTIEIDISDDGGSTWDVTDANVTGDVGSDIVQGAGKTIAWDAKTDFNNQEQNDMRVRVRGLDTYSNQSGYTQSSNFSLDTVDPAVNVTADLQAQPNAGDTTVLIGGSFTENNPDTNDFYVEINNSGYGDATAGDTNTAAPSNQATAVGATLDGNDYISKVKIIHTDDFGQTGDNENTSPAVAYKYVKPYTPQAPTIYNPTVGTVDVIINPHAAETSGLEYAIYETTQVKYIQANGTLGASAVWQTTAAWGTVTVNGLVNDSYTYEFQIKSRNTSDSGHAASSESSLSTGASSANQAPEISINSVAQTTDGTKYVTINYTGSDLESETSSLVTYKYSTDNATWYTMTEKSGVGSDGTSGLAFSAGGASHDFMWDVGTDLNNTEDSTVYIRLQANDGTTNGNAADSSAFVVDTKNPVIASPTASQTLGTNSVVFEYNLTDLSNSTVELDISEDGGSTWDVTDTSVSGDIDADITPGAGKSITWDAGSDFNNQDQSDMRVRIRALDNFGNQGSYTQSSNFALDSADPVISNVSASQDSGAGTVTISYDISDTNNSTVEIDISEDGGSTWDVTDTSVTGDIGSDVTPGAGKSITWDAGADFNGEDQLDIRVRVRAYDVYANNSNVLESADFSLDTLGPVIANVSASQTAGTENVVITYDLTDNSPVTIEIDISEDGGSTWAVTDTSVTGDIGAGVSQGAGKTITWDAGADFSDEDQNDIKVRVRGLDSFNNSSGNIESANFVVDTKDPVTNVTANLQAQPNAGDTTVLIGGSFTETNPDTNDFYVAINGGGYSGATAGDTNTASPSNQAAAVGATLDGNDYISKVKIIHTDDYTHTVDNENSSPTVSLKYVKPYTPQAPTVDNPQNTSVDLTINKHASETSGLEYAIYENSTAQYVQANGTLSASAVWRTIGTGSGQWGFTSGISGKITVAGLTSPVAQYSFQTKSRNTSDPLDASSSESDLSDSAGIPNTAPIISIDSAAQQTGGVNYVLINYTGTDAQNDTNGITAYEYSTDNSNWNTMTEKAGVGSDGTLNLIFTSAGEGFVFAWDAGADLPGVEDSTVYIRLRSSDTIASSNLAASSAFEVDNAGPVISNISTSQTPNTKNIIFEYDLADNAGSGNIVEIDISEDSGATWAVADTSATGDIGAGVTAGAVRSITWDAGTDFDNQEQSDMRVRIKATDSYGNIGSFTESIDFTIDTSGPIVSNVNVSQSAGLSDIVVTYDLTDGSSAGHFVEFLVSEDSGLTWTVTTSTFSGDVGAGQTTGAKTFIWDAGTDFNGEAQSDMKIKVRAKDYFGNYGAFAESADFSVDSADPIVSNVSTIQTAGTNNIVISYDLSDANTTNLTVEIDISNDGGSTWAITDTSSTGDIGGGLSTGAGKTITWNAGVDFSGDEQSDMRVRIRATDTFGNISSYLESADFSVDTSAPLGLLSLSKFSSTDTTVTMNWSSGIIDANFNHYELWHGRVAADVNNRSGTAVKWDNGNDANLSNINTIATVITGLSITDSYYVKIWAVDDYGNEVTVTAVDVYTPPTPAPTTPASTVTQATAGGSGPSVADIVPPDRPILTPLVTPTKNTKITISGLAEPRSRLDLYDNGVLVGRLNNTADNNGRFNQDFIFNAGSHVLTVRAIDFSNNSSAPSEAINLIITSAVPSAPIILSPQNNESIAETTPILIGVAAPSAQVEITLDDKNKFIVQTDENGAWQFRLPSSFALSDGTHAFAAKTIDAAGNISNDTRLELTKITITPSIIPAPGEAVVAPAVPAAPLTTTPIPPISLIREATEAVELPGIPVPKVETINTVTTDNAFSFSGTSLPNQDVIVYIHSNQALIYRTRTDSDGIWNINHSQDTVELTPGDHSIYAVAVDPTAKVKSRPSAVIMFTVKRNFWVMVFKYLNLQTTIITLVVILLAMLWLHKIKKREAANA